MVKNHISREYFFGIGVPLGYTKSGQLPVHRARETDHPSRHYSQGFRRSHVQLFFAILSGFLFSGLMSSNTLITTLVGLSMLIPIVLIRVSIYSIADLPMKELDEREIVIRESGFVAAYKILFVLLALVVAVVAVIQPVLEPRELIISTIALVVTAYTLPSALIAWQSQD